MHEAIQGTRADFLIVDDCLHEERFHRVLVVGTGRVGTISAALAAHLQGVEGISDILCISEEPVCEAERLNEGQSLGDLALYEVKAQEDIIVPDFHLLMPYFGLLSLKYHTAPRPRRAKRNKQTNKRKNY